MTSLPSQTLAVRSESLHQQREYHSHSDDRGAGGDVLDETGVERSRGEINVVLLGERRGRGEGLDTVGELAMAVLFAVGRVGSTKEPGGGIGGNTHATSL